MTHTLLPTTVVGSYPQPDWLVDRDVLAKNLVPRVRMKQMWRIPEEVLEQAQDDATLIAIRDMERAGLDIITDGEVRRESYSNRFALALDGVDVDNPARTMGRAGKETLVPRVIGRIRRNRPVEVRDVEFLVANTDRKTKITLPGPFTLSQQASDEHYRDEEAMAMDYAAAVNAEAKDLKAAGVDVIQFDEPWMQARPEAAARFGVKALNRALEGLTGETVVHVCFGYAAVVKDKPSGYSFLPQLADCKAGTISIEAAQPKLDLAVLGDLPGKRIMLGVIDLGSAEVETPETVAARIRAGLKRLPAGRLVVAPDCGMKYLPRARAFGKLRAMAEGAAIVRRELEG
ncbi:5-methyltetrahydropteroyltriglutamate--homocysteine methyltransferase [Roseomonas sp. M0104]|uniref:5-methyltetrahydropteroyltriglutamate--homocysteine methyltransferase n=1 Tax=Teichococcus coralli TaxID=2545983 RepID=A0A845B4J7_9PROT|nr:5-methyltetrahydropteroyltriglutamate--homocysteine methyltransferase [Pseudoroseomonas coralli]MXP62111.1 5-methyltetrahydropteroyltriglutamate--homocysteine methyltransferase [Pseudoroseomonas coralli]